MGCGRMRCHVLQHAAGPVEGISERLCDLRHTEYRIFRSIEGIPQWRELLPHLRKDAGSPVKRIGEGLDSLLHFLYWAKDLLECLPYLIQDTLQAVR